MQYHDVISGEIERCVPSKDITVNAAIGAT